LTPLRKSAPRNAPGPKVAELRARLAEAEETLRAIRSGEVDALVISGSLGDQVFTLEGAGHAYRVLIESMNEGALTLTADEVILYANESFARMVKFPLEQVAGSLFYRFLSIADREPFRLLLHGIETAGSKIQVVLEASDGSQIPAQISIRPLAKNCSNGATIGVVVTDMTEARRIASIKEGERLYDQVVAQAAELERRVDERTRQLLEANQELEAFESSVSHDLRGPLRHIAAFAEILLEQHVSLLPGEAHGYLRKIQDSAGKMERLIEALLVFSRVSKRELALVSVDVSGMWREVLAELAPNTGDRWVDVRFGDLPPWRADPVLLRQVLVNLLSNAIKYSGKRDRPLIEISALQPVGGSSPVYSIRDNGVGFDMKYADKLFAVFERLHQACDYEGTGVGLTTVQRIIQRHGGRIWAESAPDAGAVFYFTLGPPLIEPSSLSDMHGRDAV